ncbi:MAG: hypothetical protein WCS11_05295 [Dysgonamonadaceae bacterium]|jgi:hypothetical protein|nr:hypothetical protein [Dysgonamonadaceae bacterium]
MKLKTFLIIALLLAMTSTISAQYYKTGIGARVGFFNGLTVKHFVNPNNAMEGILNFRWDGVIITGLYEWQYRLPNAPRFDYYLGVGGHIGFFDDYEWDDDDDNDSSTIVGVDLIIGLEYTFPTAPFTIGLDYKPAFNLIGDNRVWADGLALSFRFNLP